jgi:hypothetical protein
MEMNGGVCTGRRQPWVYVPWPLDLSTTKTGLFLSWLLHGEGASTVSSFLSQQKSVYPLGPRLGPPFITQGDAIVAEMHARQMLCSSKR